MGSPFRRKGELNKQSNMTREELIEELQRTEHYSPNKARDLVDFILANFEPKQPETEQVTAKEVFLALMSNSSGGTTRWTELIHIAHQAASAFNNYKPEINEH